MSMQNTRAVEKMVKLVQLQYRSKLVLFRRSISVWRKEKGKIKIGGETYPLRCSDRVAKTIALTMEAV